MTIPKRTLAVVALSALGLLGWSGPDSHPQQAGAATLADIEPEIIPGDEASSQDQESKFVLLTDGRIITGLVSEEEGKILVTQAIGVMRFPEQRIERVFGSLKEVHEYKSDQVPEIDIDEQLKLAQWCLTNKLDEEAKHHLQNVLKLDPKNFRAKAMSESISMRETRLARRQRDSEVQLAGADMVDPSPSQRPAALDSAIVRGAQRGLGVSDLPVVFDLPPNAAIRRAEEFRRYVHPVLQTYCARCHDDRHDGSFQLIDFQKKVDRTPEALRANLDSTLKLVDRENPGRSELLSSSLRPHGRGPNTRPIFQGSNDRAYQILAAWVNNLRVKPSAEDAPVDEIDHAQGTEQFAADRSRISRSSVDVPPVYGGPAVGAPVEATPRNFPAARYTPGAGWSNDEGPGATDAPLPFAVSGVMPNLPPQGAAPAPGAVPQQPTAAEAPTTIPPPNTLPQPQAAPDIPGLAEGELPPPPPEPDPSKPSTPLKLDPNVLQRALQLRNGGG